MKYVANILFSAFLFSQNTGSIYGVITDIKSGDKMPGVNVIVKGTYYGASSDMEGEYRIDNISPGRTSIEILLRIFLPPSSSEIDFAEIVIAF